MTHRIDHKHQPGPYGVCRRCGQEKSYHDIGLCEDQIQDAIAQPVPIGSNDSSDCRQQKEELGASDEHVKRMITFGEMWHRKKLTPKELADAITEAKRKHPESFPSHEQH